MSEIRDVGALDDPTTEPGIKLKAMYKALYFPLRAYQDAIYRVILQIKGQKSGQKSSMIDAIHKPTEKFKTTNHVGKVLNDACPEYAGWFVDFRNKRNNIKEGINLSLHTPADDIGIGFNTFDFIYLKNNNVVSKEDEYDEKVLAIRFSFTNEKVLRLSDVTKSLTMSSRVVDIALEQARQRTGAA